MPAAPSSTASGPASPTAEGIRIGKVGDTLEDPLWRMTLEMVERPGKTLEWPGAGRASATGEFLLAYLHVQNTDKGAAAFSLTDFQVTTKEGDFFPAVNCCQLYATTRGFRTVTFSSEFRAGDASRMLVIFDVAPQAKGLTLVFTQGKGLIWLLD